ncbi:MAG: threonine synthase [Blastocatellia bacterium]|nr:threonine synthase [Blastocatellia bacterium]
MTQPSFGKPGSSTRTYLQCISTTCQATFEASEKIYRCPRCQDLLDVKYEWDTAAVSNWKGLFDQRRMSNRPIDVSGVWRFRELLPFYGSEDAIVTLPEGNTTIFSAPRSASYAGVTRLAVKHQGLNPTGSFKDNGMTTGATQANKLGARAVACASTGNTSASMAAYAARAGMRGIVFIPGGQIAFGKLSQSMDYGAVTLQIQGDFDDAMRIVQELAAETDIYLLNSINPFRLEGQKTIAFEMVQQLDWRVPDRVVLPGGNLGNSSAIGKGFRELFDLGLIDRMPKLTVIQAEGASPLAAYWQGDRTAGFRPVEKAFTLATAIKIGQPVSWKKAIRALEWTDGSCISVSEQEIADAKAIIGRDGVGCEPASATTVAGIKKMVATGDIHPDEDIVAILTGNGLKDPDYTINYHLGELYQHAERRMELMTGEGLLDSPFANRPIQVRAEKAAILDVLEQLLKD